MLPLTLLLAACSIGAPPDAHVNVEGSGITSPEVVAGRQAKFPGTHDLVTTDRSLGGLPGRSSALVFPQGAVDVHVEIAAVHVGPYTVNLMCSSAVGYPEASAACERIFSGLTLAPPRG